MDNGDITRSDFIQLYVMKFEEARKLLSMAEQLTKSGRRIFRKKIKWLEDNFEQYADAVKECDIEI